MICFVTMHEGGRWIQLSDTAVKAEIAKGTKFAAIRIGDWIYDFILKDLGFNPIRYRWY